MRRSILLSCAIVAAVALCPPVEAADYAYRTNASGNVVLTLSGPITSVDGAVFLHEVNRNKPRIVELEGPGGDLLSAVRIGVIIHERYMWTHATGPCRSACAYIWIAGLHMLADEGVEISNHLPMPLVSDGRPDQSGIALFGWYLGKLNISVEMMEAFLDAATGRGTTPNQYFDMLAFADYLERPGGDHANDPCTEPGQCGGLTHRDAATAQASVALPRELKRSPNAQQRNFGLGVV